MKGNYINGIKRDIFIGLVTFFIAIGILFVILINKMYFKPFENLEEVDIKKNIEIVENEIEYRLNELIILVSDWAVWDDTYLFAQGLNENYRETNLVDENFDFLDVDIIMVSDNSGKILYGKQKDFETENVKEMDEVVTEVFIHSSILENKDPKTSFNDILIIDGSPVLIGSHPILKSDGSGQVEGNVVIGRVLDGDMMNEISEKINLGISFELLSKVDFDKLNLIDEEGIEIQIKDDDYIRGSYYMPEFFDKYYMKISVEMPRDAIKVAYNSIKSLRIIVPLIFILILLGLLFFLNKLVLSRIIKLHDQVMEVKEGKSISARIDIDDKADEISELSEGINSMIDEISKANSLLEAKVLERTNELQITNHRLEVEIIQRQKIQEEVTFLAYHDALTGLPNRLLLTDQVNQGILHASRQESLISIMFINLDGFKIINDVLGHEQGDELLKQVSTRLLNVARKNDSVCRIGGDEFILYLREYKDEENLDIIASKVIDIFKEPFILRNQEYFITGSMGISQYPIDGDDVQTLIKNADMAMYKAKSLGKNQYQKCSNELKHSTLETISLTNSLYKAIELNEMMLYYQPQVNGLTGEILGVEALLRWNHPEHGFVSPFKFIPLAEKTRLILPIGYWVLKTACEQCKEWQEKGLKSIKIAVNFSVHQLNYPGIIEQIEDVLEKTSLEAKYLEVEITESAAMDSNGKIKETLERIKKLGVTLSIDDFGKEYSSLNRLRELPVDRIKIDMSFIQGIGISNKDEIITKAIILLASNLGLKTIAEGVETKKQMEFLNHYMCNQLQGYYFHKPMPAGEMEKLLMPIPSSDLDDLLNG